VITQNQNLCEEAKLYYYDCLCDDRCNPIPQSISNHIEQCQHCQKQIDRLKAMLSQGECIESEPGQDRSAVITMLQLHFAYIDKHVTCEIVRPFLPGLLEPAMEIRIPTPITVHLDNCPKCAEDLKEIQKLNFSSTQLYQLSQFFTKGCSQDTTEFSEMPAVSAMAQRSDSEIVTICHVDESAKARKPGESDDLYSGFPISVEMIHSEGKVESGCLIFDFAALKEKVSAMNLKPFLKLGLAAAAVILIGFALFHNTTSAEAVSIEQMYKALENVKNVYISTFSADGTKLIQKKWISHTLNIYMEENGNEFVLFDINTGLRKTKNLDTGEVNIDQLNENAKANIEQRISCSLGLMPFYDISDLPKGSEWLPVNDHPKAAEGLKIYDLKWTVQKNRLRKWRFFIDPQTFLPKKIEVSGIDIGKGENLERVILAKSRSDSQIREVVQDARL
jgi:hypothetical protein